MFELQYKLIVVFFAL